MKLSLMNKKYRNYLILIFFLLIIVIVAILSDFGDDTYTWNREEQSVSIKYFSNQYLTKNQLLEILSTIKDPEFDINIVDLGLIYNLGLDEDKINLEILLTTPLCPYTDSLIDGIRTTLFSYDKINRIHLTVKSNPPWTFQRLSKKGRVEVEKLFKGDTANYVN